MKKQQWKNRDGVVYSTASDFNYSYDDEKEDVTLSPNQQNLKVQFHISTQLMKQKMNLML